MEPETLESAPPTTEPTTTTMELDTDTAVTVTAAASPTAPTAPTADDSVPKRDREEPESESGDGESKKQKLEQIAEEDEAENEGEEEEEEKKVAEGPVRLGPKSFGSSVEMFDYFYGLLHHWPLNVDVNKYEHMTLLDLIQKGHSEPEKKIGVGIAAFQIRNHPVWKSRCFFLIQTDETYDDFSFRKCVDHILPLPENMKIKPDVNKALGGAGHGHGSKGRRGQGNGNKGGGWGKGGRGGHGRGH
ncbi:EMBRYO DEFECTIVE 514-like protein [Drosera capensis]